MASNLSDVLRDMAAGQPPEPAPARPHRPDDPRDRDPDATPDTEDADDVLMGEVDDEAGDPIADAPPAPTPARSTAAARRRPPVRKDDPLKVAAVPVLFTVGILLLLLAGWGTLVLSGAEVWRSDRDDARWMARIMLICYPVGLCLIAGGVWFLVQIRRAKRG